MQKIYNFDSTNQKRNLITITYKIKFIDSFRFVSSSLSDLVNNLSEGLHNNKCTNCKFYLEYMSTKEEKEINKIALSSNDDKRLQTCDTITSYPYGTSAAKVCETELLEHLNVKWLILMIKRIKTKLNIVQNEHIFQIIHKEN